MPSTESFPFRRLAVDHMVQGISRVWWTLHRNFLDPQPHTFQLQAGYTGSPNATDWVDVGSPVVNGFYAEDDVQRLRGKRLATHYRVIVQTPDHKYVSQPVHVHGELSQRDWLLAREIVRKERLRHRLVSREGLLLKRIRYGVLCDTCRDELTNEITDSFCPDCHGVGFKIGYHAPTPFQCFDLSPELISEQRGGAAPPGQGRDAIVKARVIGFPSLSKEDVWIDGKSDQRWLVHDIQHAAEWRGVPLVLTVELRLAPMTHAVYRVEVGGEAAADCDLPDAGCGSVEVDHNYGGDDALAYQVEDGCGIAGATILAFAAADYEAGLRTAAYAKAATTTLANGRWSYALLLDPGDYVLVFEKTGEFGPDIVEITVTAADAASESSQSDSSSSFWSSSSDFGV